MKHYNLAEQARSLLVMSDQTKQEVLRPYLQQIQ